MNETVPIERIESKIYLIRGQKVMLDRELAELYGVKTFNLNKAVNRNLDRFPNDFLFRLTEFEYKNLLFQNGISSWGGSRYLPFAFTEQGVAMLSSVLRSKRAVQINILIMWAFIKLRQALATHVEVSRKLKELEYRLDKHDIEIVRIFDAIKAMITLEKKPKPKIGLGR